MSPNTTPEARRIEHAAAERFGATLSIAPDASGLEELARNLEHRSHRRYAERPVPPELLQVLFACAFSAPSKSDLQQADIIHVSDAARRRAIVETIPDMPWIMNAPVFLIFCANNRRIRQIGDWRGKPFVNEHLDHFMNAAVDAGLVMMNFIRAAEAAGLGTCPISAVRNRADTVSGVLELPQGVFPVAGLCAGYPAEAGRITPRLSLNVTVHEDRYSESELREKIEAYDRRRHAVLPYRRQRNIERFGEAPFYGWSEDKARQYAVPERTDFGAFIRRQGFSLK
ncbi:MAG: nitroreductase family protein [Betaproteobacteria bacterium]|nr:MAG: nitroreductase family protein [Betaproteobacteria bacterium]